MLLLLLNKVHLIYAIGPLLLPLIAAGSQLGGTAMNAIAQGKMNKKNRQFAEHMYDRQRSDALADFQMQADYNSPNSQMQRLKDAGLNPNLVYGNGADAGNAPAVRSSQAPSMHYEAPNYDIGRAGTAAIDAYLSSQMQSAQMDNIKKQGVLLDQQAKNLAAQEFKIYADTNKSVSQTTGMDIKNKYAPAIAEMSLEGMSAAIAKTSAETDFTRVKTSVAIDANERAELTTGMSMRVAAEKILNMRAERVRMQIQNMESQQNMSHSIADTKRILAQKDLLLNQQIMIEKQMDNLNQITRANKAKADIWESTPDWTDQKIINTFSDMLQGLLKAYTAPGSEMNPRTSNTNFQRIQIENKRGTWK